MNSEKLCELLVRLAGVIEENKGYLTRLDAEIGDADHGVNMARGFAQVKADCEGYVALPCGDILFSVGKSLIRVVGGSAGPLYGSFFKVIGKTVGQGDIDFPLFLEGYEKGIEKIMALGGAKEGEKTMLDAMCPALRVLQAEGEGAFARAAAAAEEAAEHTKDYIATKGRASYVGERSLGHMDPGACSFSLLLRTLADFLNR